MRAGILAVALACGFAHAEPPRGTAAATPTQSQPLRVDTGRVTSKYIGETEKNLDQALDGAEGGGAVLQQDDADALFARPPDPAAAPPPAQLKAPARHSRQTLVKKDPP